MNASEWMKFWLWADLDNQKCFMISLKINLGMK